jgi:hypothetical protein
MHTSHPVWAGAGLPSLSRRQLLRLAGLSGLAWLTPLSRLLAGDEDCGSASDRPARSLIVLWMAGGPSQLETFDPHPESAISYGTRSLRTALRGVAFAAGLERTASVAADLAVVRSVVSKEADHERAVYNMKTGYRPVPTVVHPSIGAVLCHELEDPTVEIPRHISILPGQWPARGGYLGPEYDAFQVADPQGPVRDVNSPVGFGRLRRRVKDLQIAEETFAAGRAPELDATVTHHSQAMKRALRIMTSSQLKAFDVSAASATERVAYGESPFGRGCLAALRLVEAGVRCVEVTLSGWDSHVNNHESHARQVQVLDPALAALVRDLKSRDLLRSTVVLCGGEFGRTPKLNPLGGRDHWPHGFSVVLAGGGLRTGQVVGATDPTGDSRTPSNPIRVQDLHATIMKALGVDPSKEIVTPVGRPLSLSDGRVIPELLAAG